MDVAFTNLSWWLRGGKHREPSILNGSSLNPSPDLGLWESDTLRFPFVQGDKVASSTRRLKRKCRTRDERKTVDRDFDIVLVPSDGGCVSGTESDDSDYSIGWLEPHGQGFQSDNDTDDSFAVLVPCYGRGNGNVQLPKNVMLGAVLKVPDYKYDGEILGYRKRAWTIQSVGSLHCGIPEVAGRSDLLHLMVPASAGNPMPTELTSSLYKVVFQMKENQVKKKGKKSENDKKYTN